MSFSRLWRGPWPTLADAKTKARDAANARQAAVTIYRIGTGIDSVYELRLHYDTAPKAEGDTEVFAVADVKPDPASAPYDKWPLMDIGAFSDLNMRNARAESWRQESRRLAGNNPNTVQPYGIKTGEKVIKLNRMTLTLYTYVVRKNPKFAPRTPTPTPDAPQ